MLRDAYLRAPSDRPQTAGLLIYVQRRLTSWPQTRNKHKMNHSLPATMHAVQLDEPNGNLTVREIPVPRPQAGQVLVRMAAAPINPSDLGALAGFSYSGARTYPFTPGLEGSGTVIQAGEGLMPRLLNERRVACAALIPGDGTWAEYMVTSARLGVPLNKDVSLEQGAMMLTN